MFKAVISNTPMTSDIANDVFPNISGEPWSGDYSFLATLRALVVPRMKDGDSIYLDFSSTSYTEGNLRGVSSSAAVGATFTNRGNYVHIHSFRSSDEENNHAWMSYMKSKFQEVYPDFHRLEKVTDFYRRTFDVLCFVNPETRTVVLYVENMDIRKMHYLQCSIFAFLPWYFDPKLGVSELEMELIQSLREKTSDRYEAALAKIAEQYDFRTAQIRQLLAGFETKYERLECENVQNQIARIIRDINSLNEQIGEYLRDKSDKETRLLGLEEKLAMTEEAGDSQIMEYFMRNKQLMLESVSDNSMQFIVKGYLEYFDEDMAQRVIDNSTSYVYRPDGRDGNSHITNNDMKKLMEEIFIKQTMKIKTCATYRFDLRGSVSAVSHHQYPAECRDCIPNTHIDSYSCLGNYSQAINELLVRHDYIGAIEQCVASCKSLNFGDSIVMKQFMKVLYGMDGSVNNRCIELPNGDVVTAKNAVKWMREQEEANG